MAPLAASDTVFDIYCDLGVLAELIAEHGIEAVASSGRLDAVVRAARRAGAFARLVALVVDETAPAVARERAFGRLASQLATLRSASHPAVAA
ncbi:MAG TPA: hypothetical protein VNO51_15540 [Ilumatobacteraceae bacterium]|nr:hypothetical protein [Ilumatobacteraceae bacterium]